MYDLCFEIFANLYRLLADVCVTVDGFIDFLQTCVSLWMAHAVCCLQCHCCVLLQLKLGFLSTVTDLLLT